MNALPSKNVLDTIVANKQTELADRKQIRPLASFLAQVQPIAPMPLEKAIHASKHAVSCILEIKPASPSAGVLNANFEPVSIAKAYEQYGIGISVLTDTKYFGGSLDLLRQVSESVSCPTLCKDFIIDPYQIYAARLAGAKAVLLIVKSLDDEQLSELTHLTRSLGMTPLIEIQSETELKRALPVEPSVLLVNNRDLQTLAVDLATTETLAPKVPDGILKLSASGIQSRADIVRLQPYCDGFLIGSAFMREGSVEAIRRKLDELLL